MKAVVWHGIGDIRLEDVAEPRIEQPTDAIVKITASAICGTDLHMMRGTLTGMKPGTGSRPRGCGRGRRLGDAVRNLKSVIGWSSLPPSPAVSALTAGSGTTRCATRPTARQASRHRLLRRAGGIGPFHGLQAEKVRVPFANVGLVKLPDGVDRRPGHLVSDIFPTAWMGAELAEIQPGNTVAMFGCGPVGQFAIASAQLIRAGRVFAIDSIAGRLAMARAQGAEAIDFNIEDPVETLLQMTDGIGVDRAIDAVGVDANRPQRARREEAKQQASEFEANARRWRPRQCPGTETGSPGTAPP